ncbi:MAG: DUF2490 domain-containing protein [Bacteroidota bacterium]
MNLSKLLIFPVLLLLVFSARAQNVNVAGVFPTIDHSAELTNRFEYGLYYFAAFPLVNFQNPDISNDAFFHLFYAEQALTYKKSDKLSFTGSYVYQRANVLSDTYVNENRFYLQAKYKQSFPKLALTHRLRFDGRFIQDRITNKYPFSHRFRYLLGFETPLGERTYLTAYEELFFNTFKNASPVYGENWFYAALGKKLNEQNKIEAGLLYVTWNIGKKSWFNQYYLQLTWINHLNFKKEKNK